MRASRLIEELNNMIDIYGDCHVVYRDDDKLLGFWDAENVWIVALKEGKYFLIE